VDNFTIGIMKDTRGCHIK